MAEIGKTIAHPLTGERVTFLDVRDDMLKLHIEMAPGGFLPRPHTHPRSEERFEVTAGRVQLNQSGRLRPLDVGEVVVVPRGASHVWGNPFDEPATVVVDLCPAYRMETFFETWFGLARDGKVNTRTQMPSLLQTAIIGHDFRDGIGFSGVAGVVARGLFAALAPLARVRGYRSRYPQYSDPTETLPT